MKTSKLLFYIISLNALVFFNLQSPLQAQSSEAPLRVSSPFDGEVFLLGAPITISSKSIPPSPGNCEYKLNSAGYQTLPALSTSPIVGEEHGISLTGLGLGEYFLSIRCPNPMTPDTTDFLNATAMFKIVSSITALPTPADPIPLTGSETPTAEVPVRIVSPLARQEYNSSGVLIQVKTITPLSCSYQINHSGNDIYLTPDEPKLMHHATATDLRPGNYEISVSCNAAPSTRKTASLNFSLVNNLGGPEIGSLTQENQNNNQNLENNSEPTKTCSLHPSTTSSIYEGIFFIISAIGLWFYRKREAH